MLNRKLYPESPFLKALFWVATVLTLFGWSYAGVRNLQENRPPWVLTIGFLLVGPMYYVAVLLLQEPSRPKVERPYTRAISDISEMVNRLATLSEFLENERAKVLESEATLVKLQTEKEQLEPVVLTQRETVNAILAAHAKTTATKAWRERAIGFVSGVLASLLAALIFELFRR